LSALVKVKVAAFAPSTPLVSLAISAFTVGDQLLWGAAEPLRRMMRILID
jgi:aspartate-semialdehyde dehydrogenase